MLARLLSRKKKPGQTPVYLNVYDLTPMNEYAYWFGLGIYHSGVQVHDTEYGYGAHENEITGIFEVEPRKCPGFRFRKSIYIGGTDLSHSDVRALMVKLSLEYMGHTYNLITKNCNHFCDDVCLRLTGNLIPRWVNRLARLGLFCNCVLPADLNERQIRPVLPEEKVINSEKAKLRNNSSKSASSSKRSALSPSPSSCSATPKSRQRRCISSSSSLIHASSSSTNLKV